MLHMRTVRIGPIPTLCVRNGPFIMLPQLMQPLLRPHDVEGLPVEELDDDWLEDGPFGN